MPFQQIKLPGPDRTQIDAELIPVSHFTESQATYLLADGTTITMRTVVTRVARLKGHYDAESNPAYYVQ